MKKSMASLAGLLLAFSSLPSVSNDEISSSFGDLFFVGIDLNVTDHVLDADDRQDESASASGFGFTFGYILDENWSVGVGYTDYGVSTLFTAPSNIGPIDFDSEATSLLFFGTYRTEEIADGWRLSLSAGLSQNDYDLSAITLQGNSDNLTSESKLGLWGGFGATYDLSDSVELTFNASWTVFDIDGGMFADLAGVNSLDVQLAKYGVGLTYLF